MVRKRKDGTEIKNYKNFDNFTEDDIIKIHLLFEKEYKKSAIAKLMKCSKWDINQTFNKSIMGHKFKGLITKV